MKRSRNISISQRITLVLLLSIIVLLLVLGGFLWNMVSQTTREMRAYALSMTDSLTGILEDKTRTIEKTATLIAQNSYVEGYFDSEDSEEARFAKKQQLNALRTEEFQAGEYSRAGGCQPLPVPDDAPFFVRDYSEYYKGRCYHARSLNSNDGWNSIGCMSFLNQPILQYSNEIRSAVLIVHGDKAHSYYFGKDAYEAMIRDSKYAANKELLTIPGAVHTDLYDNLEVIPFDKMQQFFAENGVC